MREKIFNLIIFILVVVLELGLFQQTFAKVIYVPNEYPTIQSAIDAATTGDEVIVFPGIYLENIAFKGKNIILRSINPSDADTVANTIINGNYTAPVVTFAGTESSTCVLAGFTITQGYGQTTAGGGINGNGTLATISCNLIIDNITESFGGGIYWCKGIIINNTISRNSAYYGGGLSRCHGLIINNTISGNRASEAGGGIFNCDAIIQGNIICCNFVAKSGGGLGGCNNVIKNNTISKNTALYGGGLAFCRYTIQNNTISSNYCFSHGGGFYKCNGIIQNNTVTDNYAQYAGGAYECSGIIQSNIFSKNSATEYGGALYYCTGTVSYNVISENTAKFGAGFILCNGLIQHNSVSRNYAYNYGGGFIWCNGTIQNNFINGNYAGWEGGGLKNCNGVIRNNIISCNSARYGAGLYDCGGFLLNNTIYGNSAFVSGGGLAYCTTANLINCIIWANTASTNAQFYNSATPSYSCVQDWSGGGTGNISEDPQFVNPEANDFHLSAHSPCIDAGCFLADLFYDFDGDIRPYDGTAENRGDGSDFDIGADEFTFNLNKNSYFSFNTSDWQYLPFGRASSAGIWAWEPDFSNQSGVLRVSQLPGEKMNICQLVSVEPGKWYTLEAKVATDISDIASTQKVYAFIGEYSAPDRIKNTIAESFQAGNLAYGIWTTLQVSFYSTVTQVGVSIISIVPQGASAGNLYIDDVMLYERAPYSASSELPLVNPGFDTDTSGWHYFAYGGATDMGSITWSGQTGYYGFLQVNQSAGNKLAGIQWINVPAGKEILGSLWVYSSAPAIDSSQKVYVLMSSYDSASTKIISNVQNALQAGNLEPYSWRELKFASIPKSTLIVPTFIVILPNDRPDAALYIDECRFFNVE